MTTTSGHQAVEFPKRKKLAWPQGRIAPLGQRRYLCNMRSEDTVATSDGEGVGKPRGW